MAKLILVSDARHLHAEIPGGVQRCTAEYEQLLQAAGHVPVRFPVAHTERVWDRTRIKLGIEAYQRYDFARQFPALRACVEREGARVVALNQVALVGFAPLLKRHLGRGLTVIVLSHGNESGDFLHEISRRDPPSGRLAALRDTCRLGRLLLCEAQAFSRHVDLVLAMSETDRQVCNWLGARRSMLVPRTFSPEDIAWAPIRGRVGFLGTLDHKPNLDGLSAVLEALEQDGDREVRVRVVGAPASSGRELQRRFSCVEYLGALSDEGVRREAATWSLFLNPVFWHGRGAVTKLAVGINWGLPVLSTPPGNRGYTWRDGDIPTVETARDMAREIARIAGSPEVAAEVARSIRRVGASGPALSQLAAELNLNLASLPFA